MNSLCTRYCTATAHLGLACMLVIPTISAEQGTAGYNHKIPEKIMTPDQVETRIGTL